MVNRQPNGSGVRYGTVFDRRRSRILLVLASMRMIAVPNRRAELGREWPDRRQSAGRIVAGGLPGWRSGALVALVLRFGACDGRGSAWQIGSSVAT